MRKTTCKHGQLEREKNFTQLSRSKVRERVEWYSFFSFFFFFFTNPETLLSSLVEELSIGSFALAANKLLFIFKWHKL